MCGHHRQRERTSFAADDKRASDTERESVVSDLRAHAAEGRLNVEELDRRVAAALAADTRRELAALVEDLPRRRSTEGRRAEQREHVRTYLAVMALLVTIWALTGAGYFWPVWPMVGWGVFVLPDALATRRGRRSGAFS